jgi:hypothetical protein
MKRFGGGASSVGCSVVGSGTSAARENDGRGAQPFES